MRDAEGRKKEESKVKQTTRQSNTAQPRQICTCIIHQGKAVGTIHSFYIHVLYNTLSTANNRYVTWLS